MKSSCQKDAKSILCSNWRVKSCSPPLNTTIAAFLQSLRNCRSHTRGLPYSDEADRRERKRTKPIVHLKNQVSEDIWVRKEDIRLQDKDKQNVNNSVVVYKAGSRPLEMEQVEVDPGFVFRNDFATLADLDEVEQVNGCLIMDSEPQDNNDQMGDNLNEQQIVDDGDYVPEGIYTLAPETDKMSSDAGNSYSQYEGTKTISNRVNKVSAEGIKKRRGVIELQLARARHLLKYAAQGWFIRRPLL